MKYDINRPWLTLDNWQKEYIQEKGNCFLLCGRQSGKTTAASIKFGDRAALNKNQIILMIAFTEKQAYNLFFKTLMYLEAKYPKLIKKGLDKPTKHIINLKNNSKIMCYAAGKTGLGLVGYTVTSLVIDEAAPMAREVFIAVSPMLSVTGGTMDLLSTPRGKKGYFYDSSKNPAFKKFYVSAENCPRHSREFLETEKQTMSKLEYAQEYLAQFLDDLKRVFSEEIINRCLVLKRPERIDNKSKHYLGVDIARMGEDEGTFEIIKKISKNKFHHVESIITKKKLTTETERKIIELQRVYSFKSIGLDAGAGTLGVSVLDHLLENSLTKRKVVPLNSRKLAQDDKEENKIKILNEDMYNNVLGMMERGELLLLDDDEVRASLSSVQFEYIIQRGEPTKLRIFGSYTHIIEGIIRAAWLAKKDKSLNMWAR